jgi:antitoxin component YwqK of YwqJK toxin-antitoxin module
MGKEVVYYSNGQISREYYYYEEEGKKVLHRKDGPAILRYYPNGNMEAIAYYKNGKLSRDDGPAIQRWSKNTDIIEENYYINGRMLLRDEFMAYCRQKKLSPSKPAKLRLVKP